MDWPIQSCLLVLLCAVVNITNTAYCHTQMDSSSNTENSGTGSSGWFTSIVHSSFVSLTGGYNSPLPCSEQSQ